MKQINLAEYYRKTGEPFAIDKSGKSNGKTAKRLRFLRPVGVGSIEYVLSGKGTVTENNRTFQVKAGDVFILHAEQYHDYWGDPEDPWVRLWVQISGPGAPDLLRLYNLANVNYIPDFDLSAEIQAIRKIIPKDCDLATIDREGPHLLIDLLRTIRNELQSREGVSAKTPAERIRELIDSVPDGNISLDKIAEEFHFSKRHVNRIFQERYRIAPHEYILNRKVAIAQSLLKKTDLSIQQIADRLHFCDAAYFAEFFRKHTGTSPTRFRKKYGNTEEKTKSYGTAARKIRTAAFLVKNQITEASEPGLLPGYNPSSSG